MKLHEIIELLESGKQETKQLQELSNEELLVLIRDVNNRSYTKAKDACIILTIRLGITANYVSTDYPKEILEYVVDDETITKARMLKYLNHSWVEIIRPKKSVNGNIISKASLTNDFELTLFDSKYTDDSLTANDLKILLDIKQSYLLFKCETKKLSDLIYKKAKKNKATLAFLASKVKFTANSIFYDEVSVIRNQHIVPNTYGIIPIAVNSPLVIYTKDIIPTNLTELLLVYMSTSNKTHKKEIFRLIKSHYYFDIDSLSGFLDMAKLLTKDTYD